MHVTKHIVDKLYETIIRLCFTVRLHNIKCQCLFADMDRFFYECIATDPVIIYTKYVLDYISKSMREIIVVTNGERPYNNYLYKRNMNIFLSELINKEKRLNHKIDKDTCVAYLQLLSNYL